LRRSKLTVESMPPDSPTAIFMVNILYYVVLDPYEGYIITMEVYVVEFKPLYNRMLKVKKKRRFLRH